MDDPERQMLDDALRDAAKAHFQQVRGHSEQLYRKLLSRLVPIPKFLKRPSGGIVLIVDRLVWNRLSPAAKLALHDFTSLQMLEMSAMQWMGWNR